MAERGLKVTVLDDVAAGEPDQPRMRHTWRYDGRSGWRVRPTDWAGLVVVSTPARGRGR